VTWSIEERDYTNWHSVCCSRVCSENGRGVAEEG
jgi:hypothetical protein